MLYLPSPSQWGSGHMKTIFSVSAFHRAVGSGLVQGRRNTSWFNFLNYIMDHGWCHEMLTTCIFYVDTWREICMQYISYSDYFIHSCHSEELRSLQLFIESDIDTQTDTTHLEIFHGSEISKLSVRN